MDSPEKYLMIEMPDSSMFAKAEDYELVKNALKGEMGYVEVTDPFSGLPSFVRLDKIWTLKMWTLDAQEIYEHHMSKIKAAKNQYNPEWGQP